MPLPTRLWKAMTLVVDVKRLRGLANAGRGLVDGRGVWRLLDVVADSCKQSGVR